MISNDIDREFLTRRSFDIKEYFDSRQIKYKPHCHNLLLSAFRIMLYCIMPLCVGVTIYTGTIKDEMANFYVMVPPVAVFFLSIVLLLFSYKVEDLSMNSKEKYIAKTIKEKLGKEVTAICNCVWVEEADVTKYYVEYMRIPDGYVRYRCVIKNYNTGLDNYITVTPSPEGLLFN